MEQIGEKSVADPKISVIIPCYNQGGFIEETIDSVLASDFLDFEIIVVNDGSTDVKTNEILAGLKKPNTTVIVQANRGPSAARNAGIKAARGEYFLPLDADDTIEPTYLRKALAVLEADPKLGFAYGDMRLFGDENFVRDLPEYDFWRLLWENQLPICSLVRRRAWEEAGGYNPNMAGGFEDWDFWIALGERGWFGRHIPETLFNYRRHGVTRDAGAMRRRRSLRAQIYRNHVAIYGDRKRMKKIRARWHATSPLLPFWIGIKEFTRANWFPGEWRRALRKLMYGGKK